MKKLFYLIVTLFLGFSFSCTNSSNDKNLNIDFNSKEQIKEENYKDYFKKLCIKEFNSDDLDMNHFKDGNSDEFCKCWTEKIFASYPENELIQLAKEASSNSNKYGKYQAAYELINSPKMLEIYQACMANQNFEENSKIELNSTKLPVFIKQCKDMLKEGSSPEDYNAFILKVDIDNYCECFMSKLIGEFTVTEMVNIENSPENKAIREQVQQKCYIDNLK